MLSKRLSQSLVLSLFRELANQGLAGRDVRDIPRLRTLRLVYDLTNEMVEDVLWEAKAEQ